MSNRMDRRREHLNQEQQYQEVFDERGVKYIIQFASPDMGYPTGSEIAEMDLVRHVWTRGDRYFKLAHKYYGNAQYWWVIAWYNGVGLESEILNGDIIEIPINLNGALRVLGV